MLESDPIKREKLYDEYLQELSGIKFTLREIDVLACILHNRGEKKIGSLLSISYRTVSVHVRNIMVKIACNSRDQVIDFVEKSSKLQYLRQYYFYLVTQSLFEKQLKKIAATVNRTGVICLVDSEQIINQEWKLIKHLEQHLKLANITWIKNTENSYKYTKDNDRNSSNRDNSILHNIYIISEEFTPNYKNNIANNIILLINKTIDITAFKDMNYIDFRSDAEYYFATLKLIEKVSYRDNLEKIIEDFKQEYQALQKSWQGDVIITNTNLSVASFQKKKLLLIFLIICVAISIFLFSSSSFNKEKSNITLINQEFSEFAKKFVSDNITDEKRKRSNYGLLNKVEKLVSKLEEKEILNYFTGSDSDNTELLNCLYVLQALANQYTYNKHDGKTARKILLNAKKIAEKFISNKNEMQINFDELSTEELYVEFNIVKGLAEMYTRVIYMLARTYIYDGDLSESVKYFNLAKDLGYKLGLYEGYMSQCNGLEFVKNIEIETHILHGEYNQAKKKLLESIKLIKICLNDDKEYVANYLPYGSNDKKIVPKYDAYNNVGCSNKIIKYYSRLILISDNKEEQEDCLRIIDSLFFPKDSSSDLFERTKNITQKMTAYSYNNLGNTLLKIHDKGLNYDYFKNALIKKFKLKNIDELKLIEHIFTVAREKSRNTDFTKADSYDGLIMVYKKMLKKIDINKELYDELKSKIEILKNRRDKINKDLNRSGWQLNQNKI